MDVEGIKLSWIVVKNLSEAIDFYTDVVGLTLKERFDEYGWAELSGKDGCLLGLAVEGKGMVAGTNAVMTVRVRDIEQAIAHYKNRGAHLIGEIIEIPGHVKLQDFKDRDGNRWQLVQQLHESV